MEGERIYTNVIRDVGLSCRFTVVTETCPTKIIWHNFMFKSKLSIFQNFCFILTHWHLFEVEVHVEFIFLALQIRPCWLPKSVYPNIWQVGLGDLV